MKRLLIGSASLAAVLALAALSASRPAPAPEGLTVRVGAQNPWTHLRLANDPDAFQFAFVSDRTGGARPGVFEKAVAQLNLLQPEFVVAVGDLIEGRSADREKIDAEWAEFEGFLARLEAPFFFVPGNHDIRNPVMKARWTEKFGQRYYRFVYKNVLFLVLNTEEMNPGRAPAVFGAEQVAFARKVLDENPMVRWTLVVMHQPVWTHGSVAESGWPEIEGALRGRPYTVFAGHNHKYERHVRNGMRYYVLATTGGGSKLRGVRDGEFDHVTWVTMRPTGPVMANLGLDGIFPEDLADLAPPKPPEVK